MIELRREKKTEKSIMGTMLKDDIILCSTLENVSKSIPAGTYKLEMTYSPKFKRNMPEILNVPNRIGVRIHIGNFPQDSDGCILVGEKEEGTDDLVIKSKITFEKMLPILETEKEITIKEMYV
jgi:hypothetical protein